VDAPDEVTTLEELSKVPDPMGPRIAIARENMGMRVDELAAHLGVTPASVAAWERDERTPRANRLQMMAGILNVSLAWLLEGREDRRMARGGAVTLDELRARVDAARALFAEGSILLESAAAGLEALAAADEDPDPSEVED
jgi:transcriptional regulator with XRE-family HTH domain